MRQYSLIICVLCVLQSAAERAAADSACADWRRRTSATSPAPRFGHAMAYDSARGVTVLFGGHSTYNVYDDTWEWNGTDWTERFSALGNRPPARFEHAMVYDSIRGVTVLFGGQGGSTLLGDTWEWNGTTWAQRSPLSSPSYRRNHAMAYDGARGVTVLFGGEPVSLFPQGKPWEWDGESWTPRTPTTVPPGRIDHAMAYDSDRGVTILFGGLVYSASGDTWEWNGTTWTQPIPAAGPPARVYPAMAYDSGRHVTTLFGGYHDPTYLRDTWEWDGTTWSQHSPGSSPTGRFAPAMAYDSGRGVTVLFGGETSPVHTYLDDTWEFGVFTRDGDLNGNGRADGRDIAPFVTALLSASNTQSELCHIDFNANDVIDPGDVPGFVQLLLGL